MPIGRRDVGRRQRRHLREAVEGGGAEGGHGEELGDEGGDERRLEDVAQRDPREKPLQRPQSDDDQTRGGRSEGEHLLAEPEYLGELVVERGLEEVHLRGGHRLPREVEDLLRQKPQDLHIVLADLLRGPGRLDQVADEARPVLRPVLFEQGDQDQVQPGEEHRVGLRAIRRPRDEAGSHLHALLGDAESHDLAHHYERVRVAGQRGAYRSS